MYKRVLVPLDGSELGQSIVPLLLEIAGPLDMTVVLLRVLEPLTPLATDGMPIVVDDLQARRRHAEEYLAPIAIGLRTRGIDVTSEIRVGRADEQILAAARELGAGLIAMSTHGRGGLGRLLFGSVAEQVLRHAEVPVFLMRQTRRPTMTASTTETKR
jgi:nucleotide-binding universal stress UspA family protein